MRPALAFAVLVVSTRAGAGSPGALSIVAPPGSGSAEVNAAAVATIASESAAIESCYAALPQPAAASTPVTARLEIGNDGAATVRSIGAPDAPKSFTACLRQALAAMKFDRPGTAVVNILPREQAGVATIGVGSIGTIGSRGSGGGLGAGFGSPRRSGRVGSSVAPRAGEGTSARVALSKVSTSGTGAVDEAALQARLAGRLREVANCVPEGLHGALTARLSLGPQGLTERPFASGLERPDLETCVADALDGLEVDTRRGTVEVRATFEFKPAANGGSKRPGAKAPR